MSWLQAIIISIIEGITEFLPISSTAHMKFANPLLGVKSNDFENMFEIVIQMAAILAVVVLYWKKFVHVHKIKHDFGLFGYFVKAIFTGPFTKKSVEWKRIHDLQGVRFYVKLFVALVPAVIVGLLLKKHIETTLENLPFIACVMIGGGIILLFVDSVFNKPVVDSEKGISMGNSFIIGWFQCLSIVLPGFSRSAATIIGGMSQKLTRSLAAEFSFLLAVPTMFAASVKTFYDVYKEHPEVISSANMHTLALGSIVSFVVALFAVKFFIGYLQKHGFKIFGYYRILIGVLILVLFMMGRYGSLN